MVLENNVMLQDGVPARMHFASDRIETITITDPITGEGSTRRRLVFDVDELNGRSVAARFSTLSEKLASQFAAYLTDTKYRGYDFIITQRGVGFRRNWTLQAVPKVP